MTYDLAYWLLMAVVFICGVLGYYSSPPPRSWKSQLVILAIFCILFLIGLKDFGKPLHP